MNLGKAAIRSDAIVEAGSCCTVRFVYAAGHPVDDTGYIKIAFRSVGDFGIPQFDRPRAPDYCSISTTGDCRIQARWDPKGHIRPWGKALFLQVSGGYLDTGQEVRVTFGDTAHGSSGWRMQTFCEDSFEFKTLVDPMATCRFRELPRSPELKIVPGRPVKTVVIAPSQAPAGRRIKYFIKREDAWGNPVARPQPVQHRGFQAPGVYRIRARGAKSNPIRVSRNPAALRFFWADFHGQTEETIGTNTIEDYFRFARDTALLDIAGHQGNDFQVTDEFWEKIKAVSARVTRPGRFAAFPGYEWSGNTPLGGDRNVYFANDSGIITRSSNELIPEEKSVYPVSRTARDLFKTLKKQPDSRPFCFAHAGGRYADMSMHDPDLECAVEAHSAWGTFEWLIHDAFRNRCRVGICANSDGHKCRPGASYPGADRFGAYGGLTCVLAASLTRDAVYEALMARRFYATTGHRCLLDVRLEYGAGRQAMMGEAVSLYGSGCRLCFEEHGTAPIERADVFNGLEKIKTFRTYARRDLGRSIKILWSGAETRGRARMVDWSGALVVRGNSIRGVVPVQFWNPARSLRMTGARRLEWESVTTGGAAGCIVELDKPMSGRIEIETEQGRVSVEVKSLGAAPRARQFGGLGKRLEIYRLPDRMARTGIQAELAIGELRNGDNPFYVRITQSDGHVAWSSPIYACRLPGRKRP